MYLLRLLRHDCFNILNFDFRFGQEVKVKLGSLFCKYFLTINDLYNGAHNCEFTSCGWWDMIFLRYLNYDFRFGQEVKVKLGSLFCKYFFTINDLYNGAKIVEFTSCGCWDMNCLIVNFDFRFRQEVKVKLGSLFGKYFCDN